MKTTPSLTVTAGDLRPALTALAKVVQKTSFADPLQQHVKVETVNRNTLRFTATDLDTFFTIDLPATISEKLDPFLTPLASLQERLRGARAADPVEIRPSPTLAASAFPAMPVFRSHPMTLEPAVTASLLKAFACGSRDDTRQVLQGVCLHPGRGGTGGTGDCLAATDGRHLFSANSFTLPGLKEPVILPPHPVFASPLVRTPGPWELRVAARPGGDDRATRGFRIDGPAWTLTGHLIDGTYPNYRQVIPPDENFRTRVTLPETALDPLVKAIGQLPGRSQANSPVSLRIQADSMGVVTRGDDNAAGEEITVPLADRQGPDIAVSLNREYLEKALRFGLNQIEVIDENSPVRCRNRREFMIIMPIRVAGNIEVAHSRALTGIPVNKQPKPRPKPTLGTPSGRKEPAPETPVEAPPVPLGPPVTPPERSPRESADLMETAAEKIAGIKEALRVAVTGLGDLTCALKAAHREQRQTEKEIRSVRQTIRSLRRVGL